MWQIAEDLRGRERTTASLVGRVRRGQVLEEP